MGMGGGAAARVGATPAGTGHDGPAHRAPPGGFDTHAHRPVGGPRRRPPRRPQPPREAQRAERRSDRRAARRLQDAAADDGVACVVVRGAGPMFSAGMDFGALGALAADPAGLAALRRPILEAWNLLEEMPKPTIAQIHGACLGGAMELALACDLR